MKLRLVNVVLTSRVVKRLEVRFIFSTRVDCIQLQRADSFSRTGRLLSRLYFVPR